MATEYPNSGIISKADPEKKAANPKWPDYEGKAQVNGVEFWVSGWVNDGSRGKFLSLKFKPKDVQVPRNGPPPNPDADDIDF